jgi:hypothetical protein
VAVPFGIAGVPLARVSASPAGLPPRPAVFSVAAPFREKAPSARTLRGALAERARAISAARSADGGGLSSLRAIEDLFSAGVGRGGRSARAEREPDDGRTIVNDEGLPVSGRAASLYRQIRYIVDRFKGRINLGESLDVMGDSYADAWTKIKALELLTGMRNLAQENVRVQGTNFWLDAVAEEGGRRTAYNTYRVFFHPAKNPESEIREGMRKLNHYLNDALWDLKPGGKADKSLGGIDRAVLVFDVRGYAPFRERVRKAALEMAGKHKGRFTFLFLDEMAPIPKAGAEMVAQLKGYVERSRGRAAVQGIIEEAVATRYIGLLKELKTIEYYLDKGYTLVSNGHVVSDPEGIYITEVDAIVRSPKGRVSLVEAKSARVSEPFDEVLRKKVISKLEVYSIYRARIESDIGMPIDDVVFSFDVGSNHSLKDYLISEAPGLSERFGFPVRFEFGLVSSKGKKKKGK